jgi:acyl-lipid omega-6 desaturase (Delta-12 desaturase)
MTTGTTNKQPSKQSYDLEKEDWVKIVRRYNNPNIRKSIWQIINSLGPYVLIWYLMYLSIDISYWITLGLAVMAAGFMVRIFIIFHDCGHGSFFKSRLANKITGIILGCLAFTPYEKWHNDHAIHHATAGNLDQRGIGDLWTLTVEEYRLLTPGKKFRYRLFRNPLILFGISPFLLFVVLFRFPISSMKKSEVGGVITTNILIIAYITGLSLLVGFKTFVLIQLPITYLSTSAGVWLFYLQHQYDDVVWTRQEDWDYKTVALEGSSYVKLPRIFQWFSGNIGFHHIHHLSPKIPNYNLEKCHKENRMFYKVNPVTFLPSLRTMRLRLWNEAQNKLISFREFKKIPIPGE